MDDTNIIQLDFKNSGVTFPSRRNMTYVVWSSPAEYLRRNNITELYRRKLSLDSSWLFDKMWYSKRYWFIYEADVELLTISIYLVNP